MKDNDEFTEFLPLHHTVLILAIMTIMTDKVTNLIYFHCKIFVCGSLSCKQKNGPLSENLKV
jgi:hypothetical protein